MQKVPDSAPQARASYNDVVVRRFAIMTVVWGIVGMSVGVVDRRRADLARPELRPALAELRHGCGRCIRTP